MRKWLSNLSGDQELRELLNEIANSNPITVPDLNAILKSKGFGFEEYDGQYRLQRGVIVRTAPVINEAKFQDIQFQILKALDEAKVSIIIVIAWFTNEGLFQKLVDKYKEGPDVRLAIFDDGINKMHDVDVKQIPHTLIKKAREEV